MKQLFLWGIFLFVLGFTTHVKPAHAKEYSIPVIEIEAEILLDGSVRITEQRTYRFDGEFSWANIRLSKSGFSAIRDIQVSEGSTSFMNQNSEVPETFLVEESEGAFEVRWFFEAEDEERVFTVSYTLEDALVIGPEWSEFFWNYVAAGREKSTDQIDIYVILPENTGIENLHSWVREPESKVESTLEENAFLFHGRGINRNENVQIRKVFPSAVFDRNNVSISDRDFSLQQAQQEEMAWHQEQERRVEEEAYYYDAGLKTAALLAGISILCFIIVYRKYGARHPINLSTQESLMIPGDQKPALIGWLLSHRVTAWNHLSATLLDLARRDYLTIEESESEKEKSWLSSEQKSTFSVKSTDKQADRNMPDWELTVLNYVRSAIEEGKTELDDIFKFTSGGFTKWFNGWKKELKEDGMSRDWFDSKSYTGVYRNLGIQFVILLAAVAGLFLIHKIIFSALIIILFALVASPIIIRRTRNGEEIYHRWKDYRNALKNAREHSIPKDHLGRHFIYSVAFGLGEDHIEQLCRQNPEGALAIYWIVFLPGSQRSPADIATSFGHLAASGGISAGGGSIAGGGASAGVAGGGTSGGAG